MRAPNFARLDRGAVGQLAAGDAGREAEVVLDPRRGARLAAGRHAVEHDRVEPLGGAVHGGRQARRPGADHDEVAERALLVAAQPEDPREVDVARVAQDLVAANDHDRRLARGDAQLAQQRLGRRIVFEVDPAVGQAVAGGEVAQAARVRREARADDAEARAEADQQRAPQHVGAQQQVAEQRVVGREVAQPLDRHLEHLAVLAHEGGEGRGLADQQAQLAEEAAGPVDGDQLA